MISRVAESCYWLARYVERADTLARVLTVHCWMVLDTFLPSARTWRPLLIVVGEEPRFDERFGAEAAADGDVVQDFLTWDEDNPTSILRSVQAAREGARTVREAISLEMWNCINALWLWIQGEEARSMYRSERQAFYDEINQRCNLLRGIAQTTMLHDEPADFMELGRSIERAGQTARILDLHHHALDGRALVPAEAVSTVEWIAILRTRYAYEPFFKLRGALTGPAVAEFLLSEATFPQSVAFSLGAAHEALGRIRPNGSPIGARPAERLDSLRSVVFGLDIPQALESGIHEVLTHIVEETADISHAIGEEYFYAEPSAAVDPSRDQVSES